MTEIVERDNANIVTVLKDEKSDGKISSLFDHMRIQKFDTAELQSNLGDSDHQEDKPKLNPKLLTNLIYHVEEHLACLRREAYAAQPKLCHKMNIADQMAVKVLRAVALRNADMRDLSGSINLLESVERDLSELKESVDFALYNTEFLRNLLDDNLRPPEFEVLYKLEERVRAKIKAMQQ
eukprot:435300_1